MPLRLQMKVGARCGYCLLHRGYRQIVRATEDEGVRRETVAALLRLLAEEFDEDAVAALIGSKRDRIIHRLTGCPDPYIDLKRQANEAALAMLPELERIVEARPEGERLGTACLIACLGNVIEYDVPGHSSDFAEAFSRLDEESFYVDHLDEFGSLLCPGVGLLFLTDNAGEIVFDRLVVRELRRLGCGVTVGVKGGLA